jgi:16S rRNA (cytidine1402-2'-O)-methyltransferase
MYLPNSGKLYVCGTPIGNLEDITLRALRILKEVDLIAAEDTRRIKKLLNHYSITKPLISYYEYNKEKRKKFLLNFLKEGKNIALVSDSGMPGIQDPGEDLIKEAIENNISVEVIPGVSAVTTALVISGFSSKEFLFLGYFPRKNSKQKKILKDLKNKNRTIIFFESPKRLYKTLNIILELLGDCEVAICRELTKKFEEVKRGKISKILEELKEKEIKGEITLVISQKGGNNANI